MGLGAAAVGRAASLRTLSLPATDDVSLPFLCNWGYDWQERCYRNDGDRLELGGAGAPRCDRGWR